MRTVAVGLAGSRNMKANTNPLKHATYTSCIAKSLLEIKIMASVDKTQDFKHLFIAYCELDWERLLPKHPSKKPRSCRWDDVPSE